MNCSGTVNQSSIASKAARAQNVECQAFPAGDVNGRRDSAGVTRQPLVLSLFPGIDLLGRAFAAAGFSVVRGPDPIFGDDIRDFAGVSGRFDGVIGGPPCQGFSSANRFRSDPHHRSVKYSHEMLQQFVRVVSECEPTWWLMENVPSVPDVIVPGFDTQRVPISDAECGGVQVRMRHIQWGHRDGFVLRPNRPGESVNRRSKNGRKPTAITTKPTSRHRTFAEQCRRQGFDPIDLPGWSREAKFRAVGNGVAYCVGRELAIAVSVSGPPRPEDCPCGCGRILTGRKRSATVTCRKRLQLMRERAPQ